MRWNIKRFLKCAAFGCGIVFATYFISIHWINYSSVIGTYSHAISFQSLPDSADLRYKIWYNVWHGLGTADSAEDISIVTQCSVGNLHYLVNLLKHWDGLVTVAVFTPGDVIADFIEQLAKLTKCRKNLSGRITIHAVIPLSHPPFEDQIDVERSVKSFECSANAKRKSHAENYADTQVSYPVNLLRNVALKDVITSHVLVVDVDMLPSRALRRQLLSSGLLSQSYQAIVIPAFEVVEKIFLPENKGQLIESWQEGHIRPFYQNVCWKCQMYTNYDQWKSASSPQVYYEVRWHDPWEPFYVAPKKDVRYDERFEQYGFNRISQLCEMHMRRFTFKVYRPAFILHLGFKEKSKFHTKKDEENARNKLIYRKLKRELVAKYATTDRQC